MPNALALSMQPLDWGLMGASALLVLSAARTFTTGKGKAGFGLGTMIVAAFVFTFAIGRQVDGFGFFDGFRVSVGLLLLIPVFRAVFGQGGGTTTAVISLLLASVSAGPVVARAFPDHVASGEPRQVVQVERQLEQVRSELETKRGVFDRLNAELAERRKELEARGIESRAALLADADALVVAERFAQLDAETGQVFARIRELEGEEASLERSLEMLRRTGGDQAAIDEAEAILRRVDESVDRLGKSTLETQVDRERAMDVFEEQFLGDG